eukprot:6490160-Amphidinium_carterae.2
MDPWSAIGYPACVFGNAWYPPSFDLSAQHSDSTADADFADIGAQHLPTFASTATCTDESQYLHETLPHRIAHGSTNQATGQVAEHSVYDHFSVMTLNVLSLGEKDPSTPLDPLKQTGHLAFLCSRLIAEKITVAFIQESRLMLPEGFRTKEYEVFQNPAVGRCGGLLTLVHKGSGARVVNHKIVGNRILCATILFKGHVLFTVNSHAPIRKAPEEQHVDFATHMALALAAKPKGAIVVGGSDLNMRAAQMPEGIRIAGPLASLCPHKAVHAQGLVRVLAENGIVLANTFINC